MASSANIDLGVPVGGFTVSTVEMQLGHDDRLRARGLAVTEVWRGLGRVIRHRCGSRLPKLPNLTRQAQPGGSAKPLFGSSNLPGASCVNTCFVGLHTPLSTFLLSELVDRSQSLIE